MKRLVGTGLRGAFAALILLLQTAAGSAASPQALGRERAAMVATIFAQADEDYPGLRDEPSFKAAVAAISEIDRTRFVPASQRPFVYGNRALPIGFDQTISDAYVVAVMTAAVEVRAGSNVFEVGTGSGYQAAVLAKLGATVHSVEIVPQLAASAARLLGQMGLTQATVRAGDGYSGWAEFAPYDAIIVTAGAAQIPAPLLDQLKIGGRLIMPVGVNAFVEQLIVVTKVAKGAFQRCSFGPASFVPLTGQGRRPEQRGLYDRSVPLCRKGQVARWPGQPSG